VPDIRWNWPVAVAAIMSDIAAPASIRVCHLIIVTLLSSVKTLFVQIPT
jgi:hypothetical protein